ncbi:hypothetical protein JJB09_23890 [Rhizobium sp. KVB221]|uniref:SHOCT domain-containing protein n=1 Tax=Rhizobium setariae TaxID=2801340 RepID=A0A936YQR7_9HYPH|nr:hypothetical protein [Rhizobium setariae]MBL0375059.1 hypothetical protein [Rhizobium setariae]
MMSLPKQKILSNCRLVMVGGLLALGVSLASCSQSTHADAPLQPGDEPVNMSDPYPDFSKPLDSAMPQLSDEEAKKQAGQLAALSAKKQSGAISEAEYNKRVAELRKLGEETKAQ